MMIERRILEALDACRPESDDLHAADHPELTEAAALVDDDASVQEALARIQHFDQQIGRAMDDVDLPAGLAARMKARLAASSPAPDEADSANCEVPATVSVSQPVETNRRRWLWATVSAVAASLAVAVGIWQFGIPRDVALSREQFRILSQEFHTLAQDSSAWQTDLTQAPAGLPFPQNALMARVKGFKTFAKDRHAVAYDVSYQNRRATVIVYSGTAPGLQLVPPRNPSFNSQGVCIGLWQRNGLLFALVVEGSASNYRQFLQSNQGTLG